MSDELVVFGTGESIVKYKEAIPKLCDKIDSLAWGEAGRYLIEHCKVYPTYYSFIDPASAIKTLNLYKQCSKKSTIILLSPIVNKEKSNFVKYLGKTKIGTGRRKRNPTWHSYRQILADACRKHTQLNIESTTIKKLVLAKHKKLIKYDLDDKDARLRFEQKFIIAGMQDKLQWNKHRHTKHMNMFENKLTMFILPLCAFLKKYRTVYLMGFDGIGGRWHDKELKNTKDILNKTYEAFLPRWVQWKEYHGMDIKTLVPQPYSLLDQWLPYVDIDTLI